ncbi:MULTISPECIES: hypothetical protein [Chryseobacterium]|jgi:hypothetical protein|uniref:Uncharacterized protein n=2 Tax=Chryseobacterium TaxID=59732 RepID=A0A848N703_9FLAO|nr:MULTISPECIES: hypothetical protein [Chryseobacterium]MDV3993850.1 hypothetical protein [Elizabethkingia anophelis]AZA79641.1 hypothetical protein EG347_20210 [Chryseobacterium sp. G0186]AZB35686.1 hypothetical protein EG351_20260 [Chryseobacterium bernardetii]EFK35966.1 hypothetical protein HMPREF0204_15035 [Chryseobacterium gleum ATCC 35910]KNB62520.1 hypothetical protein AC804_06770 [Chryseobacterium sp. Hurlbut01]
MPVPKNQQALKKNPAQKKNLKNCTTKTVASTSQIKNVTMVTTAMAIVNTALADAVLLHLLSAY